MVHSSTMRARVQWRNVLIITTVAVLAGMSALTLTLRNTKPSSAPAAAVDTRLAARFCRAAGATDPDCADTFLSADAATEDAMNRYADVIQLECRKRAPRDEATLTACERSTFARDVAKLGGTPWSVFEMTPGQVMQIAPDHATSIAETISAETGVSSDTIAGIMQGCKRAFSDQGSAAVSACVGRLVGEQQWRDRQARDDLAKHEAGVDP